MVVFARCGLVIGGIVSMTIACGESSSQNPDGAPPIADARPTADADPEAPDAMPQDLASLSDGFDGAALDPAWQLFQENLVDITVSGGALEITANQRSLWYNASQGPLVYKLVSGDFRATATVHARRASNPSEPPANTIHLAGLMARAPAAVGAVENYVFIVVGRDEVDLSVETKTTVNGASTYEGPAWPSGDAELRICRVGSDLRLYKRAIGSSTWTEATAYSRADLPATLQVGPVVYAASTTPDLQARFDEVVFAPANAMADCTLD